MSGPTKGDRRGGGRMTPLDLERMKRVTTEKKERAKCAKESGWLAMSCGELETLADHVLALVAEVERLEKEIGMLRTVRKQG